MAITKERKTRGIILTPDDIGVESIEGEMKVADTAKKLQIYLDGALRNVVTESQSQTLTNKTLVAASNIITTAAVGNLVATELNAALAELQGSIDSSDSALTAHTTDATDAHDASAISVSAISGLTATEVQGALAEHQVEIDAAVSSVSAHISNTVDAHDASAISSIPAGNLAATDLQGAVNELQTDIDTRATSSALSAHTGASTGVHGISGAVVGTTDAQTLTNKTITGADIRTPVRSDVKQDTKANLTTYALTASNGQVVFATDTKEMFQVVDTLLEAIGGGAGIGGVDILFSQTFEEAALTDFTQTGLSLSTSSPLHGAVSALMTHQSGTSQSFKQVIAVNEKFRGQAMLLELNVKSTATAGNVTISVYDETNAANIVASEQLTLSSATGGIKDFVSFTIPATCLSMSYTITALQEAGSPVTRIDDILCQLNNASLLETSVSIATPVTSEWASAGLSASDFVGFGTPINIEVQSRRDGPDLLVRGRWTNGTVSATEARVALKLAGTALTSKNTTYIPAIQKAGSATYSTVASGNTMILIEPSVTYVTFGYETTGAGGLTKQNGSNIGGSGAIISFEARIPINGWEATESTNYSIPLTQSGLIQEADSMVRLDTVNGYGSTATKIRRFTNIKQQLGSDISYTDSATNGSSFTALVAGIYDITYTDIFNAATSFMSISKNASSLSTNASALSGDERLVNASSAAINAMVSVSTQVYLAVGDIIRPHTDGAVTGASPALASFVMSRQGSLSQVSINTNSKITIPTSELRFEGSSSRGSVATAIVKFDTLAKIRGDAFTVTNTAADGTYVTMRKAGNLSISTSVYGTATSRRLSISKNQADLTAAPLISEQLSTEYTTGTSDGLSASYSGSVSIGDIIRVCSNTAIVADSGNSLNLLFQEQDIQVSVSNTLPQFSESDSSVRVDTANGYGSTATKIRRFSNVRENLGVDVLYVDSATNGASFTAMESGIYDISYSDSFSTSDYIGISKNSASLTTSIQSLTQSEKLAINLLSTGTGAVSVSWTGYLVAGDVLRPHTGGATASVSGISFTMSKVGKPNVTGVDVTPFVNIPQPLSQSYMTLITTLTASTDLSAGTVSRSTGSGIFSLGTTGVRILKPARLHVTLNGVHTASTLAQGEIFINGAIAGEQTSRNGSSATNNYSVAYNCDAQVGDLVTFIGTSLTFNSISIVAVASPDQILTVPETFSTDTAPLVYASSATYTLTTLANAPVGTFITYTMAASGNVRTQTTSAPTQATSSMNTNGIQMFTRAYNATSTFSSPATIAIQIGKGLKGLSLGIYRGTGKDVAGSLDHTLDSSTNYGAMDKTYNETTGVLVVDLARVLNGSNVTHEIIYADNTSTTSGYLVINASKNPALTGMNINSDRVATISYEVASGTAGGSYTLGSYVTRPLNTIIDPSGIVTSLASNQFILPAGKYTIDGSAQCRDVLIFKLKIRNITDSTDTAIGVTGTSNPERDTAIINGQFTITSPKTFELQMRGSATRAGDAMGSPATFGDVEVYTTLKIIKVG